MSISNDVIFDFYQIQKDFGYLLSLNMFREINEFGCSNFNLEIILCGFPFYTENQKLVLKFGGVRDIKMGTLDGLPKLLISVCDISNRQMEELVFKIREENDLFSFYCKAFIYDIL